MESDKYLATSAVSDGGYSPYRYEAGSDLSIDANLPDCGGLPVSYQGKTYNTVEIGHQCWFQTNLDYDNGCTTKTWVNSTDVGWCGYYTGGPFANEGLLYQWSAAMNGSTTAGAQGICPSGWHIPTHDEWTTLERTVCTSGTCTTDFLYDTATTGWRGSDEGTKLKVGGSSGFNGILAGSRDTGGSFNNRTSNTNIWSSVESGGNAWKRNLNSGNATVNRNTNNKAYGFSVRCLKNWLYSLLICHCE
jgi:uncharacterized protein (TIGR02145 family)